VCSFVVVREQALDAPYALLGPVNTYAITATVDVNRQCNEEGAAKGGSLGATTEAAMAVHVPVPRGYGRNPPVVVANLGLGITKAGGSRLVRRIFGL
jgi:hypothetical protein